MRTEEALLLLSGDGTIQWSNAAAASLLGYSSEELCQLALPSSVIGSAEPAVPAGPVAAAFTALRAGERQEMEGEARFPSKDGKRVAVHWKLSVLPLPPARSHFLLALSETAQASEEGPITSGYRDIFEHAVEGIFRSTLEGAFLEVNPALARMYGYSTPAQLMEANRDLNQEFYVEEDRRQEFVALMQENGFVADFESRILRADGSIIWIAEFARTVSDARGQALYFEGSVIDITERKAAERALQRSEEKFRHLVEKTDVVPWEADLEMRRFRYIGPQAVRFLGYPPEEWLQEGFLERLIHEEDREWVAIVRAEAIVTWRNFECEYRMLRQDGKIIWAREIVSVLQSEDGRTSLGGFLLDVTHRREAEQSLRESWSFIEQVASASPTILYSYEPATLRGVYVNGCVHEMLGFTTAETAEMSPFFLFALAHPEERAGQREHFQRLCTELPEGVLERELRARKADRSYLWLRSRERIFKTEAHPGVLQVVGTVEDITEQKLAAEGLAANEALFRRLAETTRVIPFAYDSAEGRFSYIGPQAEAIFGHPLSTWYGTDGWRDVIHPDDLAEGQRFAGREENAPTEDFQTEFRLITPDQQILWVRQIVHFDAEDDRQAHVRGFFLDVTEQRRAEDERERSRKQLRELAARHQLVREEERVNIAREIHDELGQALTLFKIDLSWLSSRLTKAIPEEILVPVEAKIRAMEQLMSRTLQTVRRILSALRPPLLDELGLGDAIEWQVEDFCKRVGMRREVSIGPITPLPQPSATAVYRILQEILTNVARHARASRIKVRLGMSDDCLVLRVEDNGCGIPAEKKESAQTFGLLGMRERAWMIGGEIEITGGPGQGTTVTLRVPAGAGEISYTTEIDAPPSIGARSELV